MDTLLHHRFLPIAMKRFLDEGNSNTFAQKNNLKSKISLQTLSSLAMLSPSLQRITSVVKFCRQILLYVTLLEIWFVFSEMARQQSHQRGWRRCEMISHAGLLSRPRQSEWICNRVTLTQHQSPVTQNSYLESRSPKELEVQDRFVRTAMTRQSR